MRRNPLVPFLERADKDFADKSYQERGYVLRPNLYEGGFGSPEFVKVAENTIAELKLRENQPILEPDKFEKFFKDLLVPENLERSIKDIHTFPSDYFKQYTDSKEVFHDLNNFFARFDGRGPRQFLTPALWRLTYLHPDLVRQLSRVVIRRQDMRGSRTPETMAFRRAKGDRLADDREQKLHDAIGQEPALLEAWKLITPLVDQNDMGYNGREGLPLADVVRELSDPPYNQPPKNTLRGVFFI